MYGVVYVDDCLFNGSDSDRWDAIKAKASKLKLEREPHSCLGDLRQTR